MPKEQNKQIQSSKPIQPVLKKSRLLLLRRMWKYLSRYRGLLLTAVILLLLTNALSLAGPKLSGLAIDAIGIKKGGANFEKVFLYTGLMALCFIGSAVFAYLLNRVTIRLTRNTSYAMRRDVFNKLVKLPVGYFDQHQAGDVISVLSYDIDTVNESMSTDFLQILNSLMTVSVSFVFMLTIQPQLVIVFAVTVPLTILYTRWITKKTKPLFRKRSAKLGELNGFMEEMISGQKTTKAYGRQEEVIRQFDQINAEAVRAYTTSEYYGTIVGPSVNFINNISLAVISVFGSLMFLANRVGLGDIASFIQYSRKFSGPINETASILGELQSAFAAAERVFRLIDETEEQADALNAKVLTRAEGEIQLDHIRFSYEPGKTIIDNFDLLAKPGSLTAIVGPTGAGKTTLINLLMRFYDVQSGRISVDQKDIYSLTRESLRKAYTMVLQDSWLFYGTVFENITYAKPSASREEVEQVARTAKIHDFISKLPKGYDTMIGDDGVNMSKGQKQLLTIARAMLSDAPMLILDEATSNVDTRTERQIQAAMRELMKDRTAFVIAHRLSTIENADNILVMNDGHIVEQGKHKELMRRNGFYTKLYTAQFDLS